MRCFVLIGLPATGKTTWREENLPLLSPGAVVISGDDLIDEECRLTGMSNVEAFRVHDFAKRNIILRERFLEAIKLKRDIVIDRTNMTPKGRRSFLANLPKRYEKIAVVFTLPLDELFKRLDARGEQTGKIISHDVVYRMIETYKPPTLLEFDQIVQG